MKKIKLFLVTAVAIVLLSVVGQGSIVFAQDKVQVTFWHSMNAHNQEMITTLVEEFNQSQNRIEVIEQNQGDNNALHQKIIAAGVGGELPTISQVIAANQPEYIANDLLVAIDDYINEESAFSQELFASIYPGFLPEVTFDNLLYGIPFNKSVRVLYVNNTILAEIGAEIPTSWDDFYTIGEQLKENGHDIAALGVENSLPTELESMARSNSSVWISDDLKEVDIASDIAIQPLETLQDLIAQGYARTAGEDGFMSSPFGNGDSVFYYGSSAGLEYFLPVAEENGYDISAIEVPSFGKDKEAILFGNNIGMFNGASEDVYAGAVEFLAYLLSPDNTVRWAINSGYLPITTSGVESDLWQEYLAANPVLEAASKTLEYATSSPSYAGQGEVYSELEIGIEDVLINGADAKEKMTSIETLVNEQLGLQ